MYCSGCGTQIRSGLNYCSGCGRRVADEGPAMSRFADSLMSSLGYIGGFGFIGYIVLALALVKKGVPGNILATISFFYLASLFGVCWLILRQTQPPSKGGISENGQLEEPSPEYLKPADTTRLTMPADSPLSVTEHTTKGLEKVLVERK